jgi:hypothetical protein
MVSSGSITRDTDGLDRKEGLKYGGQTVVNPLLLSNSPNISLSALLGAGNTASPAVTDADNNNNFNNVIANLLSNALSNESSSQTTGVAANEKIKSALYQAAAMLLITGGITSAATQDTATTAKDTVVSTIMQNNSLTPAQKQIFLNALKSAAIAIASTSVPSEFQQDISSAISASNNNNTQAKPITVSGDSVLNSQAGKTAAAAVSAGETVMISVTQTNVTETSMSSRTNSELIANEQVDRINFQETITADQTKAMIPGNTAPAQAVSAMQPALSDNSVSGQVKSISSLSNELVELAKGLELLALAVASSGDPKASKTAGQIKGVIADVEKMTQVVSSLAGADPSADNSKLVSSIKASLDDVASKFNIIAASSAALQIIPQQSTAAVSPAAVGTDDSLAVQPSSQKSSDISMLFNFGQGSSKQGNNNDLEITSSNQPQFGDIAAKIAALLKDMNGNLEVISKVEYATVSQQASVLPKAGVQAPASVAATENTSSAQAKTIIADAVQQQQPQQAVQAQPGTQTQQFSHTQMAAPAIQQATDQQAAQLQQSIKQQVSQQQLSVQTQASQQKSAAALVDNNIEISNNNSDAVMPVVIPVVMARQSADNNSEASVLAKDAAAAPANTSSAYSVQTLTPEAVSAAARLLNNDSVKYQPANTSKNFVQDINWVANNIIKPAITPDSTADLTPDQMSTNVASFARSIKDQVVLKQVVMNLNNSQPVKIDEIHMVLKPENLGTITIKIEHSNNEIKGSFTVSNNDVKDIIKAGLPELKNTLANLGIKTDSLDVTVSDGNAGAYDRGSNGQFNEWEGAVPQAVTNDFNNGADVYSGAMGYLNYLA